MSSDNYSATYSPDDNKLRLYAVHRLDDETYQRVKAAGFRWAPKQDLFVAPAWTPAREDLLLELAGEIDDEDTSLVDRAEQRAERFEVYSDKREADAEAAERRVSSITDGIPLGQPILVGHHSERHARKHAEQIENGTRKALRMWETSRYWEDRAAGALRHAKYKERPEVRARRIKKLEAERRAVVRSFTPKNPEQVSMQKPFYCPVCRKCFCSDHPEANTAVPHVYCGAARGGSWTRVDALPGIERGSQRWLKHYDLRLAYERAMLGEQGRLDLLEKPKRPKAPPLLNYRADELTYENSYNRGQFIVMRQVEATKAQYAKVNKDYKGTRYSVDKSHRFRTCSARSLGIEGAKMHEYVAVFLTDSKVHPKPDPQPPKPPSTPDDSFRPTTNGHARKPDPKTERINALRDTAKNGVQIVSAPELYETPVDLAERMVDLAGRGEGMRWLEPSAGTGRLLRAIGDNGGGVHAVEINFALAEGLRRSFPHPLAVVHCCDFLDCEPTLKLGKDLQIGTFDRVVMNPPFAKGADVAHVMHAVKFLKPGGRLVAVMSAGITFREQRAYRECRDMAEHMETLPAGTFKNAGTNVNTALIVISG